MAMLPIPKIAVTGTKGKTTVVNVVASVLQRLDYDVLKVDTTGHYVNGEQRSTLFDSQRVWNLVPSVSPGRYLYEFHADPTLRESSNPAAVLEAALGSSASAGLGYREHEVGVFLNVMEDHIGSSARLQSKADIAKAKNFIMRRVKQNGYVVFNGDDEYVVNTLSVVPGDRDAVLVPCGIDFAEFDIAKHLEQGGVAVTRVGEAVVLRSQKGDTVLCNLKQIPWAFNGQFPPSVYNLMHAAGALYGFFKGELPDNFQATLEATRLEREGGRLTLLKAANGATILADYAHEKYSLAQVGDLAHTLTQPGGKVIGVVRLAYDRTPELIHETGLYIASHFDEFVVYDKIDGYWKKAEVRKGRRFQKEVGKISQLLTDALTEAGAHTERIIREDEAIAAAAAQAGPADAVVVIVNDDIKRSLEFIEESFKAEYV